MAIFATRMAGLFLLCTVTLSVFAQDAAKLQIDHLNRLAERAMEAVEVSLDHSQLQFVKKLARLDRSGHDEKLEKMNSVYVRMFEFEQDGEYAQADIEAIRAQLRAPGWERLVKDSDRRPDLEEDTFIMQQNGEIIGYAAIYADARKVCVINVTGRLDREDVKEFNRSDCRGWNSNRRGKVR